MITNLLLTVISLGTWRGAGHSKHAAQSIAQQNQMLFDAMADEEKARVLGAAATRQRIARDRLFIKRMSIWGGLLVLGAIGMATGPHPSTKPQIVSTVAAQPVSSVHHQKEQGARW